MNEIDFKAAVNPNETEELEKQYMTGWRFEEYNVLPQSYSAYIWTNKRIIWVSEYDGSTGLNSAPRHPCSVMPTK